MVENLKRIGYVNTFIITTKPGRFDEQLNSTIFLFSQMFSSDFFKNVLVCITNFGFDKKSISNRKNGIGPKKEAELIEEMQKEFKDRFGCDLSKN